ncbi:uncharacterized protein [Sinocyclocheilus grahami]|uniref:uncharacterized protein n=1 Tax=Sinocyclocheilus grahami TaxID=75366 RepID=UPI0007ACC9A0|nr:PREDICTED: uncharacterized protein LOC107578515 [Sinocyclocheilus grahami]
MICILLVAGHGTILETQIKSDVTGLYAHLTGVPKALLPGVGGKKILDFWWETVNTRQLFSEVYLVTNADNLQIAGDMLCADQNFDIAQVIRFFRSKPGELAIYYELESGEKSYTRGIVEVCPNTHRMLKTVLYLYSNRNLNFKRLYYMSILISVGEYIPLDMSDLPWFWLAYLGNPSDSGRIHSNVRQRWLNGESAVVEAMKSFAELTDQARAAFQCKDWPRLAQLMDENFELRRSVYTDDCLGPGSLKMVQLARQFGSAVKLPGSGGAVVGLCMDTERLVWWILFLI